MPCSTFLLFRAKSRNLLLSVLSVIRDVSTSLEMTKNGLRTFNFSVFGDRRYRLPLFIRRSRGRFRLHRGDDLVRTVDRNHSAHCAGIEHPGCAHRVFSILARRTFLMEIILAFRFPFLSGSL